MRRLGSAKAGLWPPFRQRPGKTVRADALDRCTSPRSEKCGLARGHPRWSRARPAADTKIGSQIESTAEPCREAFFVRVPPFALVSLDSMRRKFSRSFL